MKVGAKYKAFLKERKAEVEFLEGTTLAGKTTVGLVKYMTKVYESPQRAHIIAGLDKGVIEKNLINKDHGIAEVFGDYCEYYGNGRGSESIPHILFRTGESDKIIYCLGYVYLVHEQAAILTAQSLLPSLFIIIAKAVDDFIAFTCPEEDMGYAL